MRKHSNIRAITAASFFVVAAVGLLWNTGLGTPSSFGWDAIATICPLGFLESLLAGGAANLQGLICMGIVIVLVLVSGRAFCGWACPVPLLRRVFGGRKRAEREHSDLKDTCAHGCASCASHCTLSRLAKQRSGVMEGEPAVAMEADKDSAVTSTDEADTEPAAKVDTEPAGRKREAPRWRLRNSPLDSRHAVLVGALLSTVIFGFPVFCLICPVGLSIATFIALWRFISLNEATWSLLVFPAILIVELVVMRRWCHRLCPISACLSLLSKGNRVLRPTVDPDKCLRVSGKAECHACCAACPEAIDLHALADGAPMNECVKCRECAAACPAGAITFPLRGGATLEGTRVGVRAVSASLQPEDQVDE